MIGPDLHPLNVTTAPEHYTHLSLHHRMTREEQSGTAGINLARGRSAAAAIHLYRESSVERGMDAVTRLPRPGHRRLTRQRRREGNLFGLPDGPWFPWSREFRWDLMPWNRGLRRRDEQHKRREELIHLVEAAAGTIGIVARQAGFEFNLANTSTSNGDVTHAVLYEASADEFTNRYPGLGDRGHDFCVDLWVYWYREHGQLEVNLDGFGGPHGLEMPNRPDLVDATRQPVEDRWDLRPVLQAWSEGLQLWLEERGTH